MKNFYLLTMFLLSTPSLVNASSLNEQWKGEFVKQVEESGETKNLEYYKSSDSDYLFSFGEAICKGLKDGKTKTEILSKGYYPIFGVLASDAMYDASVKVICSEFEANGF